MRDGLPEIGEVIANKFLVERELGRGGMGCVYAVTHLGTGKTMAIKCLLPQFANNPDAVERFLREARAVGRIQHRHVIDIFDVMRDDTLCLIVMPFLDGLTLTELCQEGRLTRDQALTVLIRAMEGVAAAHAAGIVHRDLKPCNIMVCRGLEGRHDDPRVLDFGISKLLNDEPSRLTASGAALGTPNYMALEQLVGDRHVDARADIFSMGVILYEILTGKLPHVAQNVAGLTMQRITCPPDDLGMLKPDLPTTLAQAVMRALSIRPQQRQAHMLELVEALRPVVHELAGGQVRVERHQNNTTLLTPVETEAAPRDVSAPPAPASLPPDALADSALDVLPVTLRRSGSPGGLGAGRSARLLGIVAVIGVAAALLPSARDGKVPAPAQGPQPAASEPRPAARHEVPVRLDLLEAAPKPAASEAPALSLPPRSRSAAEARTGARAVRAARGRALAEDAQLPALPAQPATDTSAQPRVAPPRSPAMKASPPTPDGLRPEDF